MWSNSGLTRRRKQKQSQKHPSLCPPEITRLQAWDSSDGTSWPDQRHGPREYQCDCFLNVPTEGQQIPIELEHSVHFRRSIKRVSTHGTKFIWKADSQEIWHIWWSPKGRFYINKSCHWNLWRAIWIQSTFCHPMLPYQPRLRNTRPPKPSGFRISVLHVRHAPSVWAFYQSYIYPN